ncbi:MAG: hypothetical protein JSS27_06255 [Planctomycetes bacterium]|nr:hypothetical protein [Planctomycetota bacterium]
MTSSSDQLSPPSRLSGIVLAAGFGVAFAGLLAAKLTWGVFDYGCPTYCGNMIWQIATKGFPAEFAGTPGVVANYHQGTFWLSAQLSKWIEIEPAAAIRWVLFLFSVANFTILSVVGVRTRGPTLTVMIMATVFFSASPPTCNTWPLNTASVGWFEYISLFEYLAGTSTPIAFLLMTCLVIGSSHGTTPARFLAICLPPLLLLPIINPTAFMVSFLAVGTLLAEGASDGGKRKLPSPAWILPAAAWLFTYFLPRCYPSAMLQGDNYEPVKLGLRLFATDGWVTIGEYLALHPMANHFTLIFVLMQIVSLRWKTPFGSRLFLLCYLFPLVVSFDNVFRWDNTHKFVLLSSMASLYVWLIPGNWFAFLSSSWRRWGYAAAAISLLCSIPSQFNLFATRMTYATPSFTPAPCPDDALYRYLRDAYRQSGRRCMLWPYGDQQYCGRLAMVVSNTNVSCAGAYFSFFLLAPELEAQTLVERDWFEHDVLSLQSRYPSHIHVCIAPHGSWRELESRMADKNLRLRVTASFEHYRLGELSPWDAPGEAEPSK